MKELSPFVIGHGGTVVEVGSRDGHDAREMAELFHADRVVTVEANPESWRDIQNVYPNFENYNIALGDRVGTTDFYAVRHNLGPVTHGQSSILYKKSYDDIADKITVDITTMDEFVKEHNIDSIEALKIDVEGATLEFLHGFESIRMTRLLHVESEHEQFWEGQYLYEDTVELLEGAGYERVYFAPAWANQSDTIWRRVD